MQDRKVSTRKNNFHLGTLESCAQVPQRSIADKKANLLKKKSSSACVQGRFLIKGGKDRRAGWKCRWKNLYPLVTQTAPFNVEMLLRVVVKPT
jgi:hypothetical protein